MRGKATPTELYIYLYVVLVAAYVVLTLVLPPNEVTLKKYDITESQSRLLSLTVVVPVVAIWFAALYGFIRIKNYAQIIKNSNEGEAFNRLADGLMILAFSLPIGGTISAALGYISRENSDLAPTATIWRNYVSLVLFIAAFMLISKGAASLVRTLRTKDIRHYPKYWAPALIVLSSIFTALIVARPAGDASGTIYYLPNWLIVTTLAIPYLLVWHMGMVAAYHLYVYKNKLRGDIYKRAFANLAMGIAGIVGVSIVLQFVTTITEQLNRLNLAPLLIVLYLLIALYAVGYSLVARGAQRLKKIEEV